MPNTPIPYTLIRRPRKTLGIYIRNGGVEVRAPLGVPVAELDKFVASREKWINEKLALAGERQEKKREFTVRYGSRLLWRGAEYPLLGDGDGSRMWLDERGFHLPAGLDADALKRNVIKLYKVCAGNYLTQRARHFAALMGAEPHEIKVTAAKTRWGSCSKRMPKAAGGPVYNVNFSWRLGMAEDDVIDAVVVHELAHIRQMNHSAAFYATVKAVLPDYDERSAKLKALSKRLGCEDWGV